MPNLSDSWIIKPATSNNYPVILEVAGFLKVNESANLEIEGANFTPDSYPVIDWLGSSGGSIVSFAIDNPNLCKINIIGPSSPGNYPIQIVSNGLTSAEWGRTNFVKVVNYNTGWIDLTSNGPDLGIVESLLNEGQSTRNIVNSGFMRDASGLSKDPAIGTTKLAAIFKDYPLFSGHKLEVIFTNYQTISYPFLGAFFDQDAAYQNYALLSVFVNSYRGYFYSHYPAINNFITLSPSSMIVTSHLENTKVTIEDMGETYLVLFEKIVSWGASHEEDTLTTNQIISISKQEGIEAFSAFLRLGFYASSTSVATYFKAFKIT
jgi:hypothetical protein